MKEFLIGLVSFFLSGLGLGGGVLFIPALTAFCGITLASARTLCLLAFVASSLASSAVAVKSGLFRIKGLVLVPAALAGSIAAAVIFRQTPTEILGKIYGVFLVLFGIAMLAKSIFKKTT